MRNLSARLGVAALAGLVTLPVLAQPMKPAAGESSRPTEVLLLLFDPAVQKEIGLNAEQQKYLTAVEDRYKKAVEQAGRVGRETGAKAAREATKAATEEAVKNIGKLREGMTQPQARRLRQLEVQALGLRGFLDAEVSKELQLTDLQKEAVRKVVEDNRAAVRETFGNFEEVSTKAQALDKEGVEKVVALLTPDQKQKWTELTGPAFEMKSLRSRISVGNPGGGSR